LVHFNLVGWTQQKDGLPSIVLPSFSLPAAESLLDHAEPLREQILELVRRSSRRRIASAPELLDESLPLVVGLELPEIRILVPRQEVSRGTLTPLRVGAIQERRDVTARGFRERERAGREHEDRDAEPDALPDHVVRSPPRGRKRKGPRRRGPSIVVVR